MNEEKISCILLAIVALFAILSFIVIQPSNTGESTIKQVQEYRKESAQDHQDYAYSRIGYAQGVPSRTVYKDVAHIPSLIDKVERIEPTPYKGLDRTGPNYVTPTREKQTLWVKKTGFEKEPSKHFFS